MTASPRVKVVRRPGLLSRVRIGMRASREARGWNGGGSSVGGGEMGRKPLGRETVKGEREDISFGLVGMVVRRGKLDGGMGGPIVAIRDVLELMVFDENDCQDGLF